MKIKTLSFLLVLAAMLVATSSCNKDNPTPTPDTPDTPDTPVTPSNPDPDFNCPPGAINGLFTINDAGDRVCFAKGNLQYQASSNTWRFAEHQYDFVGSDEVPSGPTTGTVQGSSNHLISSSYSGWIDLFSWGTSGFNHGATGYQPWCTYFENNNYYAYGDPEKDLFDETGEADWGFNHISNGGSGSGFWHTLKATEWEYILNKRVTPSGKRFAKAQILGVFNQETINGIVILPDNWSDDTYSLYSDNGYEKYKDNVLSLEEFDVLEKAGAVFIPAAGRRINGIFDVDIEYTNDRGFYWSSSHGSSSVSASDFNFSNIIVIIHTGSGLERRTGQAVRLVQYILH